MLTQEDLQYIRKQNSCGIKVGDKVKVLRKAEDYENGWGICGTALCLNL